LVVAIDDDDGLRFADPSLSSSLSGRREMGSTFTVCRAKASNMTIAKNPAREKPLILLVDDYPDTVELTADYLQFRGFDVITATDGGRALELAGQRLPDLMLLDLSLPVIEGLEVVRRLKTSKATARIRVIAFTAHALESKAAEARAAGCDGFIAKPAVPPDMVREIQRVLGLPVDPQPASSSSPPR
jgi:two-component system cell cycle response regulator DivK